MLERQIELLVGDNAFHGISHLSQQRARERSVKENPSNLQYAAKLVNLSLENGASGFMFSVSETTLSVLKNLNQDKKTDLYAIVPYAYEYVRMATHAGGISGLAKKVAKQIIFSKNVFAVSKNLPGLVRADPSAFLKIYLIYEISRIRKAAGKNVNLKSVLLHEVITDMALALDLDWFFKSYVKFFSKSKIRPGFETRNFPYMVEKFKTWKIDLSKIMITASFNKVGFQMNPSRAECEKTLQECPADVVAMSILAAGYLKPFEAVDYIDNLAHVKGVVVGVSNERQATETFDLLKNRLYGKKNSN
jgi:hypothetical protein